MKFTFYGHACFSVVIKGKIILFDPFISPNELAAGIDVNAIKADYILISHGHFDHIADALTIAKNNNATIVSNYEIVSWYAEKQDYKKGHPMNHGGSWQFDFGKVKYVNAVHSSVLPDGTYGGNPGGFVIESEEGDFYYSGDTALTMDMKLIPMTMTGREDLEFCVLPVGDNFTMGVEDAILASDFVRCNKVVGVHFDTFGYIKINHEEAVSKFAKRGKTLIVPKIGETIEL